MNYSTKPTEMKRICHLTYHPPFDTRIFHKECKTLAKAGYDVCLLVPYSRKETVDGVEIIPLPKYRTRFKRFLFLPFKTFLLALKQKAQVYHFHDPAFIITGIFLKIMGKKVVYDVHEDYKSKLLSKFYIPPYIRKPIALLFDCFEKLAAKFFDAIIVVEDYIYQRFKHHRKVQIANFPPVLSIPRNKKDYSRFVFVYAGGISKERGILKILSALEYLQDYKDRIKIVLLGPCEDNEVKEKMVKNETVVSYLGYRPWSEVMTTYSSADAGLLLLQPVQSYITVETPVKLFEYMLAGLPVISSNFIGLKKFIEENKCGICVDPTNPKEIAEAMKFLIEYPVEAREMGKNGKKIVLERYNWEREGEKLIKLYKELTG